MARSSLILRHSRQINPDGPSLGNEVANRVLLGMKSDRGAPSAVRESEADLPELSLQVLKALRANVRLTIAQIASVTGANRNTLKVRLRELVAEGRVRRHGKARATWYSL